MSLIDVILPKNYKNGDVLFGENLDSWRLAAEEAFANVNLNLTQLGKDVFGGSYEFNNDGDQSEETTIQQQILNVISGAYPITGTSSDTFTINSDAHSATLSTSDLTNDRTIKFPDESGTFATQGYATDLVDSIFPVGSYLIFDDFDGTLALPSAGSNYWPCDGTAVNSPSSLLHGVNTKDVTGRCLVGFTTGVEGDASIDTAGAMGIVGNASHQVFLEHDHTFSDNIDHTHGNSITATVPAHYHGKGTLNITASGTHKHQTLTACPYFNNFGIGGSDTTSPSTNNGTATDWNTSTDGGHSHASGDFDGEVGNTGGSNGDAAFAATMGGSVTNTSGLVTSGTTSKKLSATQDIRMRSIEVRCYVRIL